MRIINIKKLFSTRKTTLKLFIGLTSLYFSLNKFLNRDEIHFSHCSLEKIDWTDYEFIKSEQGRTGPGEHGVPVVLEDKRELELAQKIIDKYSHNGFVSDMISLDRALPDPRHENCRNRTYYANLPAVSIIIAFRNEYLSSLLRTLHSLINRTPKHLLSEIILVDDCSIKDFLKKELDDYVKNYHPDTIKIIRLTECHGLAKARSVGIKAAKSEIVVVFDAHIEVNINWLPPLIEPIVDDYQVMTEPLVYYIDSGTYAYDNVTYNGRRESFSWSLTQYWMDRDLSGDPSQPYENAAIMGGLMAINRKFFLELEGYDEGLEIWGGEQWDISFKVWRCSEGTILTVPCSQVGHNFKSLSEHPFYQHNQSDPYLMKNTNRIAEIWFDIPHNEFFKKRIHPEWVKYGTGDVTKMIEYQERKNCKSFQWYLDNIYPEFGTLYPMKVKRAAQGQIGSFAHPNYCIDTYDRKHGISLFDCSENYNIPELQYFVYTPLNEIRAGYFFWLCWDAFSVDGQSKPVINLADCHYGQGNQYFTFDPITLTIVRKTDGSCLECDMSNMTEALYFSTCTGGRNQKWRWSFTNQDLLQQMQTNPVNPRPKPDPPPPMNRRKIGVIDNN